MSQTFSRDCLISMVLLLSKGIITNGISQKKQNAPAGHQYCTFKDGIQDGYWEKVNGSLATYVDNCPKAEQNKPFESMETKD